MKNNDLANSITPKDVVVFEGLLGLLPTPEDERKLARAIRRKRWRQAVDTYVINEMLSRKIWDLSWRFSYDIDILTYVGYEFAEELEIRLHDREALPVRNVFFETPAQLARRLAVAPDIRTVYDPDPGHQFTYGSKGRVLAPDQYLMLGAM